MISVLVTGATTPTGERLVRSLVADTRVAHVLAVGHEPPERALPFSHGKRLTYMRVNLASARRVRELLFGPVRDLGIEIVVHLSGHRDAHSKGRKAHALNVESVRSILQLSDRHPTIRRMILKSHSVVYRVSYDLPNLITEDHPVNMEPDAPQYIRDRVEADLTACASMGLIDCEVVVLRCAEALAADTGSQLFDFLNTRLCMRPAGFDPMVNVATVADTVRAVELATHGSGEGVFNVPGYDTLPLSEAIRKWGTPCLPAPGSLIRPVYGLRHALAGNPFSYGLNRKRMHLGLVLDGTRASSVLRYQPENPVDWPRGGPIRSGSR